MTINTNIITHLRIKSNFKYTNKTAKYHKIDLRMYSISQIELTYMKILLYLYY